MKTSRGELKMIRHPLILAILLTCAVGPPAAAQDAARMQPRSYRVVLENDKVRVLEFRARPGMGVCGVGVHSHPGHVTVLLTDAKVRVTQNGQVRIIQSKAGDAFWEPPVTHEVENYGGNEVRSLIIEVKTPTAPGKAK
jgi:quercetin dioxygenase-like cupin family protein